jgi:hypothetical protein
MLLPNNKMLLPNNFLYGAEFLTVRDSPPFRAKFDRHQRGYTKRFPKIPLQPNNKVMPGKKILTIIE